MKLQMPELVTVKRCEFTRTINSRCGYGRKIRHCNLRWVRELVRYRENILQIKIINVEKTLYIYIIVFFLQCRGNWPFIVWKITE